MHSSAHAWRQLLAHGQHLGVYVQSTLSVNEPGAPGSTCHC
jgi:hypothetical protein